MIAVTSVVIATIVVVVLLLPVASFFLDALSHSSSGGCSLTAFPGNYSIWEAQIFAIKPQKTADSCINRFVPFSLSLFIPPYSHFKKTTFLRIDLPRDSSEDWARITRISMRIGEKTRFARIWPSASKIVFSVFAN